MALRCELCCTAWGVVAAAAAARTQAGPSGQAGQLLFTVAPLTLHLEQEFRKTEDPRSGLAGMLAGRSHCPTSEDQQGPFPGMWQEGKAASASAGECELRAGSSWSWPVSNSASICPHWYKAKLLKRQQRMIKNRESACQSRRKKKEYLQGLEARLQAVLADNQQLRRENAALRRRLEALLAENSELKLGSGNRKVVCIMVFLLFIAFNFGPVSIVEPPPAPASPRMGREEPRPQRHLLEFLEQGPPGGVEPLQEASQGPEEQHPSPVGKPSFRNLTAFPSGAKELLLRDLDQLFLSSDCRHFNRTESLRLADELSGWVQRHQRGRRKIPQRARERQKSQLWKKSPPVKAVPTQPPGPPEMDAVGQLQLYRHPGRSQPEFLDAIDRREDTFYVVSFRRDHLLLPAISHNKTSRPKMSLVMPAMAPNETVSGRGPPGDYEEMMQIECEVMDTRVIHIKTSTVPPSLRKQPSPAPGNTTGGPLPASAARQARRASHQPLYLNHP